MPLIKKRREFRQVRMEREIAAMAIQQSKWKQRCLRDLENAARGRVGSVACVIMRDDDVVCVIAAEEKETDERFVIAGIGVGGGAEPAQIEDGVEQTRGGERGAGRLANEGAASRCVHTICRW